MAVADTLLYSVSVTVNRIPNFIFMVDRYSSGLFIFGFWGLGSLLWKGFLKLGFEGKIGWN